MKASNKVLLVALIALLISITLYNFELKAEYEKSEFKMEFYSYNKLDYKNFDEIEVNAGNLIDLKIIKAEKFDIRLHKYYNTPFKVSQKQNRLIIDVTDSLNSPRMSGEKAMVVFCPKLSRLKIKGQIMTFQKNDRLVTEVPRNGDSATELSGFNLDSLDLTLESKCCLKLAGNKIGYLNAIIGNESDAGAKFTVNDKNVIKDASIQVKGKNELSLSDPKIEHLNYSYSKESTISLTGASHSLLKQ